MSNCTKAKTSVKKLTLFSPIRQTIIAHIPFGVKNNNEENIYLEYF